MANNHILYISYDGMTDPLGQSQVLPYLAGLTKAGYRFTIISCEKPDRYEKFRSTIAGICAASNIKWEPLMYTKKPPVLSTIWDVVKMTRKAHEVYRRDPFAMAHARGSYMTSMVALGLKEKYNTKYIFDMRGFWADERVDGNIWSLKNPLYKYIYDFFKRKEKEFLEKADHVITLTYTGRDEIHSWKNIEGNPVPIQVIPCCVDMQKFNQSQIEKALQSKLRSDLNLTSDSFVLLYLGSLGTWYMLDEMAAFYKTLHAMKPNSRFLIVTNDPGEVVQSLVNKNGLDPASVTTVQAPFAQVPTYISLCDASVFFIKPAFSKKGSSPVKQGELMSMGVPVVCNPNVGDTDMIVHKYKSGVMLDDFSEASYEKAVKELLSRKFDTQELIDGAKEYFSLEEGVKRYEEVYTKLVPL